MVTRLGGLLPLVLVVLAVTVVAQRAGSIDSITPAAARAGETVIIRGRGFGAFNVRVTVRGLPAIVLAATGNQVTFRVPDGAPAGLTQVVASNPGSQTGSIGFRVLEGILLTGSPSALVKDAVSNMPPVGVTPDQIRDGVIMTRLDVRLLPDATVAQLNAALAAVQGGIVTMTAGSPAVTIAIPEPLDVDALEAVVERLNALPGIALASISTADGDKRLPPSPAGDLPSTQLQHLFPARFPAAWNASGLATNGINDESPCATRTVTVVVADDFPLPFDLPSSLQPFVTELPGWTMFGSPSSTLLHGYEVANTLAANLDASNPTGAAPFPDCLKLIGLQVAGLTHSQSVARIAGHLPPGKFLLNLSQGYPDVLTCATGTLTNYGFGCRPADLLTQLDQPIARAYDALDWKRLTVNRWDDFFAGVAAGNERNKILTAAYNGLGVSVADSYMSVATLADPSFSAFVQNSALWDPSPISATISPILFPSLRPTALQQVRLDAYARGTGAASIDAEPNMLMVGATTSGTTPASGVEAAFSDSNPDVFAVGNPVFAVPGFVSGTSFSAPQVTGLGAYLWLLSGGAKAHDAGFNDLAALPASVTRRAIVANARAGAVNMIDAYASALSVDAPAPVTPQRAPVRLSLLDLNNNGVFDDGDVAQFVQIVSDAGQPPSPDYSRFDLNGDGFTGGASTDRFDLDRVGSTQYGATDYSHDVTELIEGQVIHFNETALTDFEIVCYYAYSPLYSGDTQQRKTLLTKCLPQGKHFGVESDFNVSAVAETLGSAGKVLFEDVQSSFHGLPASLTSQTNPDPLPFVVTLAGLGTLDFGTIHLSAKGSGPRTIDGNPSFADNSGTFTAQVDCAVAAHPAMVDSLEVPPPPFFSISTYFAFLDIEDVPAQGATLTLNGTMTKSGPGNGRSNPLPGSVSIDWESGGAFQTPIQIEMDDTDTSVPINQSITLVPPGNFTVRIDLQRVCTQAATSTASLTLNYTLQ